jgi:hypothetical protein
MTIKGGVGRARRGTLWRGCGGAWAGAPRGVLVRSVAKLPFRGRLLLDSRVVDVTMVYNPTFVRLSFLKPLFFKSLKNELHFSGNAGA